LLCLLFSCSVSFVKAARRIRIGGFPTISIAEARNKLVEMKSAIREGTLVAGGYALRTKTRFAPAIRAAHPGLGGDHAAELTWTETFALTAIAYLQPVTRGEISKLAGREVSRDIIAALKRRGLIDGAIRAPQAGAPFAYVTTRKFLKAFSFA
jgi:segregation and condensation protein B